MRTKKTNNSGIVILTEAPSKNAASTKVNTISKESRFLEQESKQADRAAKSLLHNKQEETEISASVDNNNVDFLVSKYLSGDKEALNDIYVSMKGLIKYVIKKWFPDTIGKDYYEDFINEGFLGIMTALERFDISKGFHFSTYSTYWIRQAISKVSGSYTGNIEIPKYAKQNYANVKKVVDKLNEENKIVSYKDIEDSMKVEYLDPNILYKDETFAAMLDKVKENKSFKRSNYTEEIKTICERYGNENNTTFKLINIILHRAAVNSMPSLSAIDRNMNMKANKISKILTEGVYEEVSLQTELAEDFTIADTIPDENNFVDNIENDMQSNEIVNRLNKIFMVDTAAMKDMRFVIDRCKALDFKEEKVFDIRALESWQKRAMLKYIPKRCNSKILKTKIKLIQEDYDDAVQNNLDKNIIASLIGVGDGIEYAMNVQEIAAKYNVSPDYVSKCQHKMSDSSSDLNKRLRRAFADMVTKDVKKYHK